MATTMKPKAAKAAAAPTTPFDAFSMNVPSVEVPAAFRRVRREASPRRATPTPR